MKTKLFAATAALVLGLTTQAMAETDYNAIKNHGKNVSAWAHKVSDPAMKMPPADIIKTAYTPSDSGVTPFESIDASIKFCDEFIEQNKASTTPEDRSQVYNAKNLSERLKRIKKGLEVAKKADASSLSKSLETSQGYRVLLDLKNEGQEDPISLDEIVIASATKARKLEEARKASGEGPSATSQKAGASQRSKAGAR